MLRNSDQIRDWLEKEYRTPYSSSGVKDLLKRIGVTYHKVTGFLWKADPDKQKEFVRKYEKQKARARHGDRGTRRYFVDACHPIWGLDWSTPAGCCWGSGCWWGWAAVASD